MITAFRPARAESHILSASSRGTELSMTARTRSAFSTEAFVRSMPIFSTLLSVSRRPAVSMRTRGTPPMRIVSSMVSLVVPGTSVTMARSSCKRAFKRLDFPAFGLPAMTVRRPSLIIRPCSERRKRADRELSIFSRAAPISSLVRSSKSSSG